MKVTAFGEMELRYSSFDFVKLEAGGQSYGAMEGTLSGTVSGNLRLTQLGPARPDDVIAPIVRGLLTTDDGVLVYVEMNGLSLPMPDGSRAFLNALTFRTADERYAWLNRAFVLVEGMIGSGPARSRLYRIENDLVAGTA